MTPSLKVAAILSVFLGATAFSGAALAADGDAKSSYNLPFQRLSVGGHLGGMGLAGASLGFGFDPYSQVELEASARMFTGILEKQDEFGQPTLASCGPAGAEGDDVYPCPENGAMFSVGLVLGRHNTWEGLNKGVAIRTGVSTLGEIYSSVGARFEGALAEDHSLTWNAELGLGYWFTTPHRAPTDLLALPWNGIEGNTLDTLSENLLLSLRLGIQFWPIR